MRIDRIVHIANPSAQLHGPDLISDSRPAEDEVGHGIRTGLSSIQARMAGDLRAVGAMLESHVGLFRLVKKGQSMQNPAAVERLREIAWSLYGGQGLSERTGSPGDIEPTRAESSSRA